ncbi:MAG: amidase [Altererythrobacter sp.]|nr:amidase [Altererythrobacter sp.]MBO6640772.1 amidase [Altererythrobacter sp.]MBO6708530.1 amidase [Altererythrobacter sp.]
MLQLEPVEQAAGFAMRIDRYDRHINAVINSLTMMEARSGAASVDAESVLSGRTILVKDNIETREWPTTAGSLALEDNATGRDAPLIANIRANGGVIMGKTNLSEWANIRDSDSTSGWSAIGGLTRNPHATDRNACGSSSGSGAAVAAGFAWAAIGTETNGSITCPASVNGIVGFKPTVGMVSRTHVVPISATQDTAGPMTHTVYDAALLLVAMAGSDPLDFATAEADKHVNDFTAGLDEYSFEGVRIGVMRNQIGNVTGVTALFEKALADLEAKGAVLVDVEYDWPEGFWSRSLTVLLYELQRDMKAYLATIEDESKPQTLSQIVEFNRANADKELRWFGQDLFERALETTDEAAYRKALETNLRATREDGIDRLLAEHEVQFLVAPTTGPAWSTDLVNGDNFGGGIGAGSLPAIAGYPHLTVPMGAIEDLPVGLSIFAGKWQDHEVLKAGAAYEKARTAELPTPSFKPWKPAE